MSPVKAIRVGLARAADKAFKLAVRVGGVRQSREDLADVVDTIDESWALFPLVHDDGQVGAILVDPKAAVAIVEQQTMGQLLNSAGEGRALTRTDKALTQPLLDGFLRQFDEALEGAPTAYWTQGYRCEDAVGTRHLLALQLEASEYRTFDVTISFVGTERTGEMTVILPIKQPAPKKPEKPEKPDTPQSGERSLKPAAMQAPVELTAIMCKLRIPLSELNTLAPGKTLSIPIKSAQSAKLMDKSGRTSIPVKLGQLHGMRAVRLDKPHDVHVTDEANGLLEQALQDVSEHPLPDMPHGADMDLVETPESLGLDSDLDAMTDGSVDDLTDLAGLGDLPDLPEMGDLGDLPDLDLDTSNAMADADLDALLAQT